MRYFLRFDTRSIPRREAQVVVCGSGIAGLTTAIVLKELGIEPLIITRGVGNTFYSQGGIAASVHPEDSPYIHYLDTLRAGRYINNRENLHILVNDALFRIIDLQRWGVAFDRNEEGFYELALEGGHSAKRVLKVKDYTGRAIYEALLRRVKALGIEVLEGELQELLGERKVSGLLIHREGSLELIKTKALVLSTGGAASMFRFTSNPERVRGDGIGLALRAGAVIKNAEFVQFHPTVLKGTGFLISEAVRGEGALLVNSDGERFVDELLPRDRVARAIFQQIASGREVFLDMRPILERGKELSELFPTIVSAIKERGIDPYREPVPVNPAAHYYIGGIEVDSFGRTAVEGLYAVGECSCTGVHGANRLASNSLLEGVVFGYRAAYRLCSELSFLKESFEEVKNEPSADGRPSLSYGQLKELMWSHAGIERNREGLEEAKERILSWIREAPTWERTPQNRKLLDILLVAYCSVIGALEREESRGCHFRRDFPHERETYRRESTLGDVLSHTGL